MSAYAQPTIPSQSKTPHCQVGTRASCSHLSISSSLSFECPFCTPPSIVSYQPQLKTFPMANKPMKRCSALLIIQGDEVTELAKPEPLLSEKYRVQFSSVAQSCPTLCDPTNRSMPGLPVHHQLPEFTQTHVHRVGDAIQPSHPLSSPSPPAPIPPSISLFQ